MRLTRFALQIVVMVLTSFILCLAQSQPTENATGSASGLVLLAVDGRPIPHAQLEFLNPSTGWAALTLTDNSGKFELAGLLPADYQLTVSAHACERLEATVRVGGSAGPLLLRLQKAAQQVTPRNDSVVSVEELRMSDQAESAFAKGARMLQKGDVRGSVAYFQRALAKEPGYYRAYHNLGLAHYQLGEKERAEEEFQKSIDLTNGGYAPSQFALGMILCEKQEFQQAERLIQNGLAMEPGSALGKYFLGLVQFALNRRAEAEKSVHDALRKSADQADAHILLAKIHERDHDSHAVINDVNAYLKLDPHGPLESEATRLLNRARQEISQGNVSNH